MSDSIFSFSKTNWHWFEKKILNNFSFGFGLFANIKNYETYENCDGNKTKQNKRNNDPAQCIKLPHFSLWNQTKAVAHGRKSRCDITCYKFALWEVGGLPVYNDCFFFCCCIVHAGGRDSPVVIRLKYSISRCLLLLFSIRIEIEIDMSCVCVCLYLSHA